MADSVSDFLMTGAGYTLALCVGLVILLLFTRFVYTPLSNMLYPKTVPATSGFATTFGEQAFKLARAGN